MKQYQDSEWQKSMKIRLDYNNMMAPVIGRQYGLTRENLSGITEAVAAAHQHLISKSGKGNDFLGFLDLPEGNPDEISRIKEEANKLAAASDRFISLGIGGSYLGAKALVEALHSP